LTSQKYRTWRDAQLALRAAGYRDNQRILTPRQVAIIYEYLGTPEEFQQYDLDD